MVKCRGGRLEHKASPTRRGRPLQAVIPKVSKFSAPRRHGQAAQRRIPVLLPARLPS